MNKLSNKLSVKIVCFLLSFIMCVCLACVVVSAALHVTLYNKTHWYKCADRVRYTIGLSDEVEKLFMTFGIPSGIPDEVFKGIIPEGIVRNDLGEQLEAAF